MNNKLQQGFTLIELLVVIAIIAILPILLRSIRRHLWFAWRKLKCPPDDKKPDAPEVSLPAHWDVLLRRSHSNKNPVEWALPCVTGKGSLLPSNIHGWLVRIQGGSQEIQFIGRTWRGSTFASIDCRNGTAEFHSGFMADRISIRHREGAPRQIFDFDHLYSKAAAIAFTRMLAIEYAAYGIRANSIVAGLIDTPRIGVVLRGAYAGCTLEEMKERRHKVVPLGRMGTAWDIAEAAVFLASDRAKYITGTELVVDGGLSATVPH